MLFLGFSAGIPLLLIFSSLSLWLREAGIERSAVTTFSWAALAYSFKFVWAPLIDQLPLPWLTQSLGRRRAWLLLSQLAVMLSIVAIAMVDPSQKHSLSLMAISVVALGFAAATQDIVIDAYRIESAEPSLQALMSSTYIAGYRIGMLCSGAGTLLLASYFGSTLADYQYTAWQISYLCMAATMFVGMITTLCVSEPRYIATRFTAFTATQHLQFLLQIAVTAMVFVATLMMMPDWFVGLRLAVAGITATAWFAVMMQTPWYERTLITTAYLEPIREFLGRYRLRLALLVLTLIGCYRISDIVLGVLADVFYQDTGFTKNEIATVVKTFGLFMTLFGGFLGGILAIRWGVMRMLYLGAILTVVTNLLFVLLANSGHNMAMLYVVISADNLTAGLASAAFIGFLSRLTHVEFTAVQYAIFSSLMTLFPKALAGYSGTMVDSIGYEWFFILASLLGVPVLVLLFILQRHRLFEVKPQ